MEIPSRHREHRSGGLPSIFVGDNNSSPAPSLSSRGVGFGSSNRGGFSSISPPPLSSSIPMSIPNSRGFDEPPPALPPPRYVPIDGPVAEPTYPEHPVYHDTPGSSIMSAGSGYFGSLNGGLHGSQRGSAFGSLNGGLKREMRDARWAAHPHPHAERDEGYGSVSSTGSQNSIPRFRGVHHEKFQFRSSIDDYDNAQLQKLNSHRSVNNRSPPPRSLLGSSLSSSMGCSLSPTSPAAPGEAVARQQSSATTERLQLKPLSLPTRTKQPSMLESPSRFTETPLHSAVSPRSTPFGGHGGSLDLGGLHHHHGPGSAAGDFERSPISRPRRTDSFSVTDDTMDDVDFPMDETTRLHGFHIDDQQGQGRLDYQAAGQKRRASSPPGGDEPYIGVTSPSNELVRRREGGAAPRGSPTPRLSVIPQGSVSSLSTAGGRSGSFVSTTSNLSLSLTASSMTSSMSSVGNSNGNGNPGGRSPGGLSPGGVSPTEPSSCGSPTYGTPMSLTASPRSSISRTPHHRTLSEQNRQPLVSPRKLSDMPKAAVAKIQGFFMCDCCPKKPKKFETQEELNAHEAEKQYECSFCGNRFKNKNEAERHQNSLHVRRHSWSCSALAAWDRAFHWSTTQPGMADTCGYCGKEFARTGGPSPESGSGALLIVTDQDWDERMRHLTDAHKFRECNASKKFYRADHFRQHLKHSHAGTSGKWTNMLENACMMEEEPPMPIQH